MRCRLIAMLLCTALTCNQGCMSITKRGNHSLEESFAHQAEQNESQTLFSKTKSAMATTGKVVSAGALLVGILALKIWSDDDDDKEAGFNPNHLWREGYGFNNPNNERIRNGEPVVNFDGSVGD